MCKYTIYPTITLCAVYIHNVIGDEAGEGITLTSVLSGATCSIRITSRSVNFLLYISSDILCPGVKRSIWTALNAPLTTTRLVSGCVCAVYF